MFLVPINYLAILTAGLVANLLGFIWYGPLFGSEWMKLVGMTAKQKEEIQKRGMTKQYIASFLLSLVMAYVLAHFIWYAAPGSATYLIGMKTALWVWIGFIGTISLSGFLFTSEKKPWKLFVLDNGYRLVTLFTMSVILVAWR